MPNHQNQHAIVIGGSIAGLLAARVLSERFECVTIVDRDRLPVNAAPRRGVPQSVQPHVLFTTGYRILAKLFPDIGADLTAAGAIAFDWGRDFLCFQRGSWMPTTVEAIGMESYTCTRPLLESVIRHRARLLPNVKFLDGHRVVGLCSEEGAIRGLKLQAGDVVRECTADLVVDASGRSTRLPQWLSALGFTPPPATIIDAGLGYATRRYRIPERSQPAGKILLIGHEPPQQPRLGYLAQVEDGEWIATLGGYERDYPPLHERGFLEFAQTLNDPAFYHAIESAQPISEIRAHRATANRRYHYERIALPDGLIAIGDAVCALCPVYGQGMTVSALSAIVLRRWLQQPSRELNGNSFHKQLARTIAFPWSLATGFDSRFVNTQGALKQHWASKLFEGYTDRLSALARVDTQVHLRFLKMAHMQEPPSSLLDPRLLVRALF